MTRVYWVTSAHTGKRLSGPFEDYGTAAVEADRQKRQSIGGYGRFNIVSEEIAAVVACTDNQPQEGP